MKSDDEWINVEIDKKWLKRFRFSNEAIQIREEKPVIRIRVIKKIFKYINQKGEECKEELIYFTNLDSQQFSTEEILQLYSMRWDIEVSYYKGKIFWFMEEYRILSKV